MRITLLQPAVSDGDRVLFAAEAGRGVACWRGSGQAAGETVDIELEIKSEIHWSQITSADVSIDALSVHDGKMSVRGTVEDIDSDGVLTLRIHGAVLLVDTIGEVPLGIVGREIVFVPQDVEIYPTAF